MKNEKKPFYKSKTVWANILVIVGGIVLAIGEQLLSGAAITLIGMINLVLRIISNSKLEFS